MTYPYAGRPARQLAAAPIFPPPVLAALLIFAGAREIRASTIIEPSLVAAGGSNTIANLRALLGSAAPPWLSEGRVRFSNLPAPQPMHPRRSAHEAYRLVEFSIVPDRPNNDLEGNVFVWPPRMDLLSRPVPRISGADLVQQESVGQSRTVAASGAVSDGIAITLTGLAFMLAGLLGRSPNRRRSRPYREDASSARGKRG